MSQSKPVSRVAICKSIIQERLLKKSKLPIDVMFHSTTTSNMFGVSDPIVAEYKVRMSIEEASAFTPGQEYHLDLHTLPVQKKEIELDDLAIKELLRIRNNVPTDQTDVLSIVHELIDLGLVSCTMFINVITPNGILYLESIDRLNKKD